MCAGSYKVTDGRILLDGVELQRLKKHQIAGHGVARTYQNIRLFDGMTVQQNLEVCLFSSYFGRTFAEVFVPGMSRRPASERAALCRDALERFGLARFAGRARCRSIVRQPEASRRSPWPPCSSPRC